MSQADRIRTIGRRLSEGRVSKVALMELLLALRFSAPEECGMLIDAAHYLGHGDERNRGLSRDSVEGLILLLDRMDPAAPAGWVDGTFSDLLKRTWEHNVSIALNNLDPTAPSRARLLANRDTLNSLMVEVAPGRWNFSRVVDDPGQVKMFLDLTRGQIPPPFSSFGLRAQLAHALVALGAIEDDERHTLDYLEPTLATFFLSRLHLTTIRLSKGRQAVVKVGFSPHWPDGPSKLSAAAILPASKDRQMAIGTFLFMPDLEVGAWVVAPIPVEADDIPLYAGALDIDAAGRLIALA